MGYFSNGGEGSAYQEVYCDKCWHDRNHDCPIWMLHILNNYKQEQRELLDSFIPIVGITNQECRMFVPLKAVNVEMHQFDTERRKEIDALARWNAGKAKEVTR